MKKLLALLLALLLPAGALAETFCLEAAVTANEEVLAAMLQASMATDAEGMPVANAASMAKAAAKLLNGFGVKIVAQEDAALIDVLLRGSSLMDYTVYMTDDKEIMTSSLMPGYGLVQHTPADEDVLEAQLNAELMQLLAGMSAAGTPYLQDIQFERTRGSFAGDAYEGGVWCTTIRLDDRDIASFLQALLTDDVREAAAAFLTASGLGTMETLQMLDARHQAVAEANEYRYILRFVEDAHGEPVGISAVVMRGDAQVATFSLGFTEEGMRIVTGFGDDQQNYWYDHVISMEEQAGTYTLMGSRIEFAGAKEDSFAYALAVCDEELVWSDWALNIEMNADGLSWRYEEETGIAPSVQQDGVPISEHIQANGAIDQNGLSGHVVCHADGVEYLAVDLTFKPCEAIAPLSDDLILVDMESDDWEQQLLTIEAETLLVETLSQRMLTILPLDVMLVLVQLAQ